MKNLSVLCLLCLLYIILINISVNSIHNGKLVFYNPSLSITDGNHIGIGMNPICNLGLLTNYILAGIFLVQSQLSNENLYKYRKVFLAILILYIVMQVSMNSFLNSAIVNHASKIFIKQTNATMNSIPDCNACSNEISYYRPNMRIGLAEYMIPVYAMQLYILNEVENMK